VADTSKSSEITEITPPFAGIAGLATLAWIILGIFDSLDEERYYFTATMFLSGLLAAYQLRYSRRNKNPIQGGTVVFFVIIWLAVFTFTPENSNLAYDDYSLSLRQVELLALLPLALIWVPPYNEERFFGIMELEKKDKLNAIWRSSVLLLIIINLIEFDDTWYWRFLEFLILIPMIYETIQLQKDKKDQIPVLTLFIQTEIGEKFGVLISMIKSVFFIMVGFLFGILDSRIWLLVILTYFGAGMIWGITSLIPEEMRSDDESAEDFGDTIRELFGAEKKRSKVVKEFEESTEDQSIIETQISQTSLIPMEVSQQQLSTETTAGTFQEKAHAIGKRVRTGIEKPYYTLNHILSTLKEEDFSQAWRVNKDGLVFPSIRGKWSPPKNLILFPVELENYDYRRTNEILLLGFNRPFTKKEGEIKREIKSEIKSEIERESGESTKSSTRITDNSIRFGDVEFNTRSLIVTQDQWSEIKPQLEVVTQDDDISYTGFKTLKQMQEVLASLSDKWLEVRLTAQEAAVNFLAGLLGSSKPIFIPREGLQVPSYPEIGGKIVDVTIENEED
jgi:hypothetical protein